MKKIAILGPHSSTMDGIFLQKVAILMYIEITDITKDQSYKRT